MRWRVHRFAHRRAVFMRLRSSTDLGVGYAVRDETFVLRSGSDQRLFGAAHHQPLREQLWRRSYPLLQPGWVMVK